MPWNLQLPSLCSQVTGISEQAAPFYCVKPLSSWALRSWLPQLLSAMELIMCPPPSCWNPSSYLQWLFGVGAFKGVVKVKWGCLYGALTWEDQCPYKKRKGHESLLYAYTHTEAMWGHSWKAICCSQKGSSLPRNQPCWHLELRLAASRLCDNECRSFNPPPVLFCAAAPGD